MLVCHLLERDPLALKLGGSLPHFLQGDVAQIASSSQHRTGLCNFTTLEVLERAWRFGLLEPSFLQFQLFRVYGETTD